MVRITAESLSHYHLQVTWFYMPIVTNNTFLCMSMNTDVHVHEGPSILLWLVTSSQQWPLKKFHSNQWHSCHENIPVKVMSSPCKQIMAQYHGGWWPSSDDSFHSPTIILPSPLEKPSIMKRYHHRRATRWGVTARSLTMVTLHDTRFVECRWWNDCWTVKTVVTWWSSASMIPAPGLCCFSVITQQLIHKWPTSLQCQITLPLLVFCQTFMTFTKPPLPQKKPQKYLNGIGLGFRQDPP